jgi:hypothetical protein
MPALSFAITRPPRALCGKPGASCRRASMAAIATSRIYRATRKFVSPPMSKAVDCRWAVPIDHRGCKTPSVGRSRWPAGSGTLCILAVPALNNRVAHERNERSAHEPKVMWREDLPRDHHPHHDISSLTKQQFSDVQSGPSDWPWMIGPWKPFTAAGNSAASP